MRLAAMVSLVIEEVKQQRRQMLLEVGGAARAVIADRAGEIPLRDSGDVLADPRVLGAARGAQLAEILEEDAVELPRLLALAGEPVHPDPVADEKMVQRAVQRPEEGAAVASVFGIGNAGSRVVEPLVDPGVVGRVHLEQRFHGALRNAMAPYLNPGAPGVPASGGGPCGNCVSRS